MKKKSELKNAVTLDFQAKINHIYNNKPVSFMFCVQKKLESFFSLPLAKRLERLREHVGHSDTVAWERLDRLIDAVENADDSWGITGAKDGIAQTVDTFVEANLTAAMEAIMNLMMIEALIGAEINGFRFQPHMRSAACLHPEKMGETEEFLKELWAQLYEDPRKKWLKCTPGGSKSELTRYAHALCFHYERLHPIWKRAKSIYKKHGGGERGIEAVKREFKNLDEGERWVVSPEFVGLPDGLIRKLEPAREDAKEYDSSPEYIAYEHAAFLCRFNIGDYSVRQIKRVINAHKKMLGKEYYNQLFKIRDIH